MLKVHSATIQAWVEGAYFLINSQSVGSYYVPTVSDICQVYKVTPLAHSEEFEPQIPHFHFRVMFSTPQPIYVEFVNENIFNQ